MIEEHWYYYLRCEKCKGIQMNVGPKKSDTTWKEFGDILLRSSEARSQFRFCESCNMYTLSILIGFDSPEEKTIN